VQPHIPGCACKKQAFEYKLCGAESNPLPPTPVVTHRSTQPATMAKRIARITELVSRISNLTKAKDKTASRSQEQGKKPNRTRRTRWLWKSHHAKDEVDVDVGGSLGNKNGVENGDSSAAVSYCFCK
jgi:hypothetical protein